MDYHVVDKIARELRDAIAKVARDNSVQIRCGMLRHGLTTFKMSLEGNELVSSVPGATLTASPATAITAEALRICKMNGLDPNKVNSKGYTLVDYNSRRPKYPWTVVDKNDKRWKIANMQAIALFKMAPGATPTIPVPFSPRTGAPPVQSRQPSAPAHNYAATSQF